MAQDNVIEEITRVDHDRLVQECAKLDPVTEQQLADEGLSSDFSEWPEY